MEEYLNFYIIYITHMLLPYFHNAILYILYIFVFQFGVLFNDIFKFLFKTQKMFTQLNSLCTYSLTMSSNSICFILYQYNILGIKTNNNIKLFTI